MLTVKKLEYTYDQTKVKNHCKLYISDITSDMHFGV